MDNIPHSVTSYGRGIFADIKTLIMDFVKATTTSIAEPVLTIMTFLDLSEYQSWSFYKQLRH